ncbi:hypothetical protein ACO0QE_003756 [Hanseniaspora vineae]
MRSSAVLLSALTKRTKKVRVQILKDFPKLEYLKGDVVEVKPSLMNNVLHGHNGAKFILQSSDIDQALLEKATSLRRVRQEMLEKERQAQVQLAEQQLKQQKEVKFFTEAKKDAQKDSKKEDEGKKLENSAIDKNLTLKDIKIPGLDL